MLFIAFLVLKLMTFAKRTQQAKEHKKCLFPVSKKTIKKKCTGSKVINKSTRPADEEELIITSRFLIVKMKRFGKEYVKK